MKVPERRSGSFRPTLTARHNLNRKERFLISKRVFDVIPWEHFKRLDECMCHFKYNQESHVFHVGQAGG